MRIISKFRDYYDSAQGWGIDERCVYLRKTEEFLITDPKTQDILKSYFKLMKGRPKDFDGCAKYLIGFCGKLYPVWALSTRFNETQPIETRFFYAAPSMLKFLKSRKSLKRSLDEFMGKKSDYYRIWQSQLTHESMDRAIKDILYSTKLNHLFVEHKAPCFVIEVTGKTNINERFKLTINPCLKDYEFFKVEETFSAYQNINMYISGILGLNDPDIAHISDKDMKAQKGFDKWSFKKLPTKRR